MSTIFPFQAIRAGFGQILKMQSVYAVECHTKRQEAVEGVCSDDSGQWASLALAQKSWTCYISTKEEEKIAIRLESLMYILKIQWVHFEQHDGNESHDQQNASCASPIIWGSDIAEVENDAFGSWHSHAWYLWSSLLSQEAPAVERKQ